MARLTVEDCEHIIPNRFELVITAASRSRDIQNGAPISVERDSDKVSVIALREIAAQSIDFDRIDEILIRQFQNPGNLSEYDDRDQDAIEPEEQSTVEQVLETSESFEAIEQEALAADLELDGTGMGEGTDDLGDSGMAEETEI